jgi:hypothetical protein
MAQIRDTREGWACDIIKYIFDLHPSFLANNSKNSWALPNDKYANELTDGCHPQKDTQSFPDS